MLTSSNSTSIYISLQSSLPPPTPAFFVFFFSFFKLVTVPSHGWLQRGNARAHFWLVNYTVAEQTVRGSHVEYTYTAELDFFKDCEDFSTKQVGSQAHATEDRELTKTVNKKVPWRRKLERNPPAALAAQIRGGFDPPAAFYLNTRCSPRGVSCDTAIWCNTCYCEFENLPLEYREKACHTS